MPLTVKDRVQETSTTTGTGTYTLAGAVTGYQSFSVIGNGNKTYYAATDGTNWEVGVGTYTSSGTTLSRDAILESSNSNNAVNWSAGTKNVFVTWPADASSLNWATTATAAGTTTLTNQSAYFQFFTGTTTQTVQLPVVSTLAEGWTYHITNNSTGNLTVNSSGGNLVITVLPGTTAMVTCISVTGTTAASWEAGYTDFSTATGTGAVVLGTSPAIATPTLTDPIITGAILEDVFTITDGAAFEVDPGNGTIQIITLGANRTPKATNFAAGESVQLLVSDGTAYTITWTDSTWGTGGVVWVGGVAPTLATSGYTVLEFWKVGSQVYGALVGSVA